MPFVLQFKPQLDWFLIMIDPELLQYSFFLVKMAKSGRVTNLQLLLTPLPCENVESNVLLLLQCFDLFRFGSARFGIYCMQY